MNENVSFISSTKSKLHKVAGSNQIYYFQFTNGSSLNPREELFNYINGKVNSNAPFTINKYLWGLFKRPVKDNGHYYSDEEFIEAVEQNKLAPLGNTYILPNGRDYTQTDQNGNILVATSNSQLENETDGCGNMLIDGNTGDIIRAPRGSVIINKCNKNNGHYLMEIYNYANDPKTGRKQVVNVEYNFLDGNGKCVCPKAKFHKSQDGKCELFSFKRNFFDFSEGKFFSNWNILPNGYVLCSSEQPIFFDGECDLIKANRNKLGLNLPAIIENEESLLTRLYLRKIFLDNKLQEIGKQYDLGNITTSTYEKIINLFDKEYANFEDFEKNYQTQEDLKVLEKITNGTYSLDDVNISILESDEDSKELI